MAKYMHLGPIWPCWDKMHVESKHLPHKGSHDNKDPITWKNTDRAWVRSGPGGTKCIFPSKHLQHQSSHDKKRANHKNWPCWDKMHVESEPPQSIHDKMEPIILENADRTWVRFGRGGAKWNSPAKNMSRQGSHHKIQSIM